MLKASFKKRLDAFCLEVEVEVKGGELLGFLGASGSGKSMSLKCIAGLQTPDSGVIELNGKTLFNSRTKTNLTPQQRRIGYLFQNYALFPQMSVAQNIFVSTNAALCKEVRAAKTQEALNKFGLNAVANALPCEISGGQQQRVGLARIVVNEPEFLLLDEPFSALDAFLKWQLAQGLAEQIRSFNRGGIVVSHNINEIYFLCEKMAVFDEGAVVESGAVGEILTTPKSEASRRLIAFCDFGRREIEALKSNLVFDKLTKERA